MEAGLSILKGGTQKVESVNQRGGGAEAVPKVSKSLLSIIIVEINSLFDTMSRQRLHRDIKREIEILLSALSRTVEENKFDLVMPLLVGIRNTFRAYKINSKYLEGINTLLIEHGLIK
jgi:hypothetical protein